MLKSKPLLLAAAVAIAAALMSASAQAFWGPFNVFRGWGGGPWYGGYPYYGYPYYGYGAPYWPYYGGWGGYPYHGGWGYPYAYGWGAPYVAPYPVATTPAVTAPSTEPEK